MAKDLFEKFIGIKGKKRKKLIDRLKQLPIFQFEEGGKVKDERDKALLRKKGK